MIVEITTYIAAVMFNEGYMSLLTMLQTLNYIIGNAAYYMCQERAHICVDAHLSTGELRAQEATKEVRIRHRQMRL